MTFLTINQLNFPHADKLKVSVTDRNPATSYCIEDKITTTSPDLMSLSSMLPFSLNSHLGAFDSRSKNESNFTVNRSNFFFNKKLPLLPSFKLNNKMSDLTVATEFSSGNEISHFHSRCSSPPPPALSPASSSPANLINHMCSQTSPSPPVIVAEIGSCSSASSRTTSEKGLRLETGSAVAANLPSIPVNFGVAPRLPENLASFPRITALSSSTSSSSSSSSSSVINECLENATNGLPILEKISIVLGSPLRILNDPIPAERTKDLKTPGDSTYCVAPATDKCSIHVDDTPSDCTGINSSVPPSANVHFSSDRGVVHLGVSANGYRTRRKRTDSKASARKPSSSAAKRRRRAKTNRNDSDSDFEMRKSRICGLSRGKSDAAAVVSRAKQKANAKRTNAVPQPSTAIEAAATRRYLESPFLCLCQSGGTVSGLTQTTSLICNRSRISSSNSAHTECVTATAALPAHIISPALRGLSSSTASAYQCAHSSIPPTCPLNSASHGTEELLAGYPNKHTETKTIFSGLSYRPAIQRKNHLSQQPSEITTDQPWLCAFCGRDNTFVNLGSLYGPYWITDAERLQLPPETVCQAAPVSQTSTSPVRCSKSASSGERAGRSVRSGVITSTVTRSAAAQGRNSVANTGSLRLIIKSRNTPASSQSSTKQDSAEPARVGLSGEVWFHRECVLWAPGTFIQGNGTVESLGEALQLSLNTVCSHCDKRGAILSCCSRGCNLSYHYQCAQDAECHLNEEQYTLMCKKHKIYN
ncbi:Transcription factor 20 [Paragonimus heterotremus]|uniref:Transcription factor 20 n=1 Tax=Paragonimus heterotremus TaxID=100268 RepID=A0A8J4WF96_9TREM|nr:Transcription factor 20 [Paragonimus heterotremus]